MNYFEFSQWLKNMFSKKTNKPKNLKEFLDRGFISKEEFFRFSVIQRQVALDKAKKELLTYLKKKK